MQPVKIAAYVAQSERPIVRRAAEELARAVRAASDETLACECRFIESLDELVDLDRRTIVIASLLRDVDYASSWTATEQRLRTTYAALAERDAPAFICTVFRHVGRGDDGIADAERLLRVRRLNLFAMEMSRLSGAYVIDLDRAFSDIGSFRLQTNYLLEGQVAADQAAYVIAGSLIADALDAFVPVEIANSAAAILAATRPALGEPNDAGDFMFLTSAVPLGSGRRNRSAKQIHVTVQSSRVDIVLRNILRGSIGPREIGSRLLRAVRQRGLRKTTNLLAAGLARQLRARR